MVTPAVKWERITDPLDARKTVWWRGTWPGCGKAYLSVKRTGHEYVWAVRSKPGSANIVDIDSVRTIGTAFKRAEAKLREILATRSAGEALGLMGGER